MLIYGIGTDIVHIPRIQALLERFGKKLLERLLTEDEIKAIEDTPNKAAYLAKRFAAKEAVSKAFGTGIGEIFAFNHISVTNQENGQPKVSFTKNAKRYVDKLDIDEVMISLSDEKEYAQAFVVITNKA